MMGILDNAGKVDDGMANITAHDLKDQLIAESLKGLFAECQYRPAEVNAGILWAKVAEQAEYMRLAAIECKSLMEFRDEALRLNAEQAATISEQKTDLILSAAMLLRRLKLESQLREIRTECFDDSHWAQIIDAALNS